jgi:hypothetical protein
MPIVTHRQSIPAWQEAAQRTSPTLLAPPVPSLPPLALATTAQPSSPYAQPGSMPSVDAVREASLVAAEDLRLRTLLHHIGRINYPEVVPIMYNAATGVTGSGTPTLVLPGPATYSITDLEGAGAVVPLSQGGFLLVNSVLVGSGATLRLGGTDAPTLLMAGSSSGFTSLVTWGGTISLAGQGAGKPMTITGWDRDRGRPAEDSGNGRPYIRAVGGELDLQYVNVSSLGFWSGRTGGVAWTGISSRASTGKAVSCRFVGNTYGAFVSRATQVSFTGDLFEGNELDGLRLHRFSLDSTVTGSTAARNGANGFVVSRGATGNVLSGDLAVNNRGNGFLINGQSLVSGASPSGGATDAARGTVVEGSDAEGNWRTGILVEGGVGTVLRKNIVCGTQTGIAVRAGASNTQVLNNAVRCGGRVALSIGPSVMGTTVSGNVLNSARIGILIRNAPGIRMIDNWITGISVFGISVRGQSPGVVGNGNLIAGRGFQPVDTRGGAAAPTLVVTNVSGWQHRSSGTVAGYLRFHPLLTTWLILLSLVVIASVAVKARRRPPRPYTHTVPWQAAEAAARSPQLETAAVLAVPPRPRRLVSVVTPEPETPPAQHAANLPAARVLLYRPFADFAASAAPLETQLEAPEEAVAQSAADRDRTAPQPAAAADPIEPKPKPANQFWRWLADGSWVGEGGAPGLNAEKEAPA